MEFLEFFGLKEDPFKLTPDPAFFYPSSSHNDGLLLMDYAIDQQEGFLLVIGEPGTGKTTLLKVFLEKWQDQAEIAIVLTPRLSPEEFLSTIAEDLNIDIEGKNKNEIIRSLRDIMMYRSAEGKRVIVIVDEAQNLPSDTLEELRLLSNLETDKAKLLQIILLGQPELEAKLRSDSLRQLNQRITTRIYLKHFSHEETREYINFRVIKAGKKNLQIDNNAYKLLSRRTKGIPRLINMLVSRSLMAAYLEESSHVLPKHVSHAIQSLNHSDLQGRKYYTPVNAVAGVVVILIAISVYFYMDKGKIIHEESTGRTALTQLKDAKKESANVKGMRQSARNPAKNYDGIENTANISFTQLPSVSGSTGNEMKLLSVTADVAIIRMRPSLDAKKAGWTIKGSQLLVLNESTDNRDMRWYQISYQGEKRWISEKVVELFNLDGVSNYN